MRLHLQWSVINNHVNKTRKHSENLAKWHERNGADSQLKAELSAYFQDHEDEKDATGDVEEHLYRFRATETFSHAAAQQKACRLNFSAQN